MTKTWLFITVLVVALILLCCTIIAIMVRRSRKHGSEDFVKDVGMKEASSSPRQGGRGGLDIVIITFGVEKELLKYQSVSFQRYLSPTIINAIYILYNDDDFDAFSSWARTNLQYPVPFFVRSYRDLISKQPSSWVTQQVLKLLSYRIVKSPYILSLDTKVFLVRPLRWGDMFSGHQIRMRLQVVENAQYESQFRKCLTYFGLDPYGQTQRGPSYPPFIFDTALLSDMVDTVEDREKTSFAEWFLKQKGIMYTEYLLYQAYVLKRNGGTLDIEERHDRSVIPFWKDGGDPFTEDETMRRIESIREEDSARFVFIHRKRNFSTRAKERLHDILTTYIPDMRHPNTEEHFKAGKR
jgi:hypothetical protein